ncbi:MAG: glycosyltransferase [Bacteroidota bacterium]
MKSGKKRKNKLKILFFCSKFGGGGAEKNLLRVINNANFNKYEIHLALTRSGGNYENKIDRRTNVHHLNKDISSSSLALFFSIFKLSKLISKLSPDVVCSIMDPQNVVSLLSKRWSATKTKYLICCQNNPQVSLDNDGIRGKVIAMLARKLYHSADGIICLCDGVGQMTLDYFGLDKEYKVIYNAGYDQGISNIEDSVSSITKSKPQKISLLAVGRLTKQKGFDLLLSAVKNLDFPFTLNILGIGPDEQSLKAQAEKLAISDRVHFLGFQSNPYYYYSNADIFILSSRWEGFGNVITEAMICGTAVVASDCDFGPREIIEHERTGILFEPENIDAMSEAIKKIALNEHLRDKIALNGLARAKDFSPIEISDKYFDFFDQIISLN